jgi:hypothetical protein
MKQFTIIGILLIINWLGCKPNQSPAIPAAHLEVGDSVGMDFSNATAHQIRYKLEGKDKIFTSWMPAEKIPTLNLSPGAYSLLIEGKNRDGLVFKMPVVLKIEVSAPWYWNPWTLLFLIGIAIVSFSFAVKYFKDKTKAGVFISYLEAKTLHAQLNPHFIFNLLIVIQDKIIKESPKIASNLILDLSKLLRGFLEASTVDNELFSQQTRDGAFKFKDISLEKEIELLQLYLNFERLKNGHCFNFEIHTDRSVDFTNQTIPVLMIQPFVENAVKHGVLYRNDKAGFIQVAFTMEGEALVCVVTDNGVGRKKASEIQANKAILYVSRGAQVIKQRIAALNKYGYNISCETTDRVPQGTQVVLKFDYLEDDSYINQHAFNYKTVWSDLKNWIR